MLCLNTRKHLCSLINLYHNEVCQAKQYTFQFIFPLWLFPSEVSQQYSEGRNDCYYGNMAVTISSIIQIIHYIFIFSFS